MNLRLTVAFLVVVVYSAVGQDRFQRVYGGAGYDNGAEVIQVADDGYFIAGSSGSFDVGMGNQVLLLRTNDTGHEQWRRTYGGQFSEQAESMVETIDGDLLIAGFSESLDNTYQFYAIKVDTDGDTIWTRHYGGSQWDFCKQVVALGDGGFALFGQTYSYGAGGGDFYLIRIDSDGDTLWTKTYGGSGEESGESISVTMDGGFFLIGHTESFGVGKKDLYVIKTDSEGNPIWTKTFGGPEDEFGFGSCAASDGSVIVVGGSFSNSPDEGDFMMYKINSVGDSIKSRIEDGSTDEYWTDVVEDADGRFIVCGYVNDSGFGKQDYRYMRVNNDLTFHGAAFSQGSEENDRAHDIKVTSDGGYVIVGVTEGFEGRFDDVYLCKTDYIGATANPELAVNEINIGEQTFAVRVAPNPFSNDSHLIMDGFDVVQRSYNEPIRINVYNTVGKLVHSQMINSGKDYLELDNVAPGILSYQLVSGNNLLATGKLIKLNR